MARYQFALMKGHQVASGLAKDHRFLQGTIAAQVPFFHALGLDLETFHCGTLNARFNCSAIVINHYDYFFKQVKWHRQMPAEDFKFCHCHILANNQSYAALIYQPQVVTKIAHFQPKNQLELLAPFIENVSYGDSLTLEISQQTLTMLDK